LLFTEDLSPVENIIRMAMMTAGIGEDLDEVGGDDLNGVGVGVGVGGEDDGEDKGEWQMHDEKLSVQ
jgi:hypothetical protein